MINTSQIKIATVMESPVSVHLLEYTSDTSPETCREVAAFGEERWKDVLGREGSRKALGMETGVSSH